MFTFSDLTYVSIPVLIIWNLDMPLQEKFGLVFVMSLGFLFVSRISQLIGISLIDIQHHGSLDHEDDYFPIPC